MKHFKESEFENFEKMDKDLLRRLDNFRDYVGSSCHITSSNGGDHVSNSQHYLGKAVDVIFPKFKGSLFSLYLIAERFGFTGIGIYPHWKFKDNKCGGLHLDLRGVSGDQGARWMGVLIKGKQQYVSLTPKNLIDYGVITVSK